MEYLTVTPNPDKNSDEYKMWNTPQFSLSEIMAYSSYVRTNPDGVQIREFDRSEIEDLAKEKWAKDKKDKRDRIDMLPDGGFGGDY